MHRLAQELYRHDIKAIKLFHDYEKAFIVPILIASKPFQINANNIIFNEGDVMNEIILIKSGQVDMTILLGNKHYLIGNISSGNYFGDSEYYKNVCSITTYRAVLHCELLSISRNIFDKAVRKHLDSGIRFKNEIKQRFNNLEEVIKLSKKELIESFASNPSPSRLKPPVSSSSSSSHRSNGNRFDVIHCSNILIDGEIKDSSEAKLVSFDDNFDSNSRSVRVLICDINDNSKEQIIMMDNKNIGERHLLYSDGYYKVIWDTFVAIMIVYSVFVVPIELAFSQDAFDGSATLNLGINIFLFLMYV